MKQPIQSTMAYADMINSGNLSQDEKVSYYNDVYFTVFFYYGLINDTMEFYKKHLSDGHKSYTRIYPDELLQNTINNIEKSAPDFLQGFTLKPHYETN